MSISTKGNDFQQQKEAERAFAILLFVRLDGIAHKHPNGVPSHITARASRGNGPPMSPKSIKGASWYEWGLGHTAYVSGFVCAPILFIRPPDKFPVQDFRLFRVYGYFVWHAK